MANERPKPVEGASDVPRVRRIKRRPGELVIGGFYRAVTRMTGLRPSLIPAHMRRQMHVIGIDDDQIARVLAGIGVLTDWPYAWEAEGDWLASVGDWHAAAASYYLAQRILLTDSPLKARIYELAREAYARIEQPPIEHLRILTPAGETVAGYLQLPRTGPGPHPTVLMVPGVTSTKEELHPYSLPLLQRGWAVARIDNPRYGETTGMLEAGAERNAAVALEHLAGDERLDPSRMHLFGMSLGALMALHSAPHCRAASVVAIAGPFDPGRYFRSLPSMNHTAFQHMTGLSDLDSLVEFAGSLSLRDVAPRITVPVKVFHGGRDRTIPVGEADLLAASLGGPSAVRIWPRDHHNCLEHLGDLLVETLEWLDDPHAACLAYEREQAARQAAVDVGVEADQRLAYT